MVVKLTLPDNSIPASGRMVQCGCELKMETVSVEQDNKTQSITRSQKTVASPIVQPKKQKIKKIKKIKKRKGPDLYSPEYLARKHGIKLNEIPKIKEKPINKKSSIGFGFYNYLILVSVFLITFLKLLHFFQDKITIFIPGSSIYLNYLFETIRNIKEILLNFVLY